MSAPAMPPRTLAVLLRLAWPIILARATQSVMGLFDALMTAPLGEDALAATTTGAINAFILVILPMGVVFIVQSFAAQLSGEGKLVAARRYAWYGLAVAGLAGAAAIAAIPLIRPVLGLFDYAPPVADLMGSYLAIRMLGIGAVVATEALGNWFGGLGRTRPQMVASVFAMASDMFLNWVLIYGKLGAPAMGVDGAALSSTIGSFVGLAVLVAMFRRSRTGHVPRLGLARAEFVRMLRFGLPTGVNWFFEFAAFALFLNVVVADLGTTVLTAMNVVMSINSVSFMPAFGLSSAGAILVGQAVGRGEPGAVGGLLRTTAAVALAWQLSIGLTYLIAPALLISAFAPPGASGERLVAIGASMLALSAAWQVFDALSMAINEALRAAGDTAWCMWARLVISWAIFVPLSCVLVLVLGLGPHAVMACLILYMALLAAALAYRFASGRWREIDLTGSRSAGAEAPSLTG
jgi:MATE family multidrug resistance protein